MRSANLEMHLTLGAETSGFPLDRAREFMQDVALS